MFQLTETSVLCNNLSVVTTCEHVDSTSYPTRLQSIGRGEKPGEPDMGSPNNPRLVVPEDPGAGAVSPGVALPGTLMQVPRLTKSRNKLPTSSPSQGLAPSTSTLVEPGDTPSAKLTLLVPLM
jgi:hypothetical protein